MAKKKLDLSKLDYQEIFQDNRSDIRPVLQRVITSLGIKLDASLRENLLHHTAVLLTSHLYIMLIIGSLGEQGEDLLRQFYQEELEAIFEDLSQLHEWYPPEE